MAFGTGKLGRDMEGGVGGRYKMRFRCSGACMKKVDGIGSA